MRTKQEHNPKIFLCQDKNKKKILLTFIKKYARNEMQLKGERIKNAAFVSRNMDWPRKFS